MGHRHATPTPPRPTGAKALGAVDDVGEDPDAEVTFVATPLGAVVAEVTRALARSRRPDAVVTDVAGVKAPVAAQLSDPRFVGGHPMAGSEQVGIDGADPDLFVGATWVLTPTASHRPDAYARLQAVVTSLGAEVLALSPEQHDTLVAMVSHVPAPDRGHAHEPRRPGRGGARRAAAAGRGRVPRHDPHRGGATRHLARRVRRERPRHRRRPRHLARRPVRHARPGGRRGPGRIARRRSSTPPTARRSLPARAVRPERLAELRVPVPDRPGVLAEITTLAGDLGVNIPTSRSPTAPRATGACSSSSSTATPPSSLHDALTGRGYRSTARHLG